MGRNITDGEWIEVYEVIGEGEHAYGHRTKLVLGYYSTREEAEFRARGAVPTDDYCRDAEIIKRYAIEYRDPSGEILHLIAGKIELSALPEVIAKQALKAQALAKLTADERKALGI